MDGGIRPSWCRSRALVSRCCWCFFFSSRRRHTRWPRDWSSDVCSSDLIRIGDERVISEMHAWAVLREYEEGDTMLVELIRDGELYRTEITLRHRIEASGQ